MEAVGCFEVLTPVNQTYHRTTNANNTNACRHAIQSFIDYAVFFLFLSCDVPVFQFSANFRTSEV
jgi:hypothetical protein